MSWLSEYRAKTKRYNEACRELKKKGEIDITKMRDIKWAFYALFFAWLSFSLPYLVLVYYYNSHIAELVGLANLLGVYFLIVAGVYCVIWWQEYKFDSEVNKKVKEYLKQKEVKDE
jgi:hypothetical protein